MAGDTPLDRLRADLKAKHPGNFYVFHGAEAYLRSYYLNSLHKLLVEDFAETFNYHRFTTENLSLQAVHDSLEAIPMMSSTSMVQIDDVDFFRLGEDGNDYAKFFGNIPPYCTVVLVYETVEFKIDKRRKALAETFEKATVVEFSQPSERELVAWLARHFKKYDKQITVRDAQYLIHRTGGDMTTLLSEIQKLGAYVQGPVVSQTDIDLLVEPVLEAAVFTLTDAIALERYESALQCLSTLLQMQEEPLMILGAVGSQMRRILTAKRLLTNGLGQKELMKLCGINTYPAQKAMEYARRLPESFCTRAVEICLEADRQIKTSFDEPERILELLILRLAGEARNG